MPSTNPSSDPAPDPARDGSTRAEIACTAACFGVALLVYLMTLCPTVYVMDSPELVAVVDTFGVAHPPGYPLFTLLYGAVLAALPFGDVALRANIVTAVIAASAVAVLFRAARGVGARPTVAAAAALGVAFARDWWVQANAMEVYALDGLLLACTVLATVRVVRDPARTGAWVALGLAAGLAVGHRLPNALYLAPLVLWAELARRGAGAPAKRLAWLVVGAAATSVVFIYLPLAASRDPAMNMGDPSDASRLWVILTAGPYARHLSTTTFDLSLGRLITMLWRLPVQAPLIALAAAAAAWTGHRAGGALRHRAHALTTVALVNIGFVALYNVPDIEGFLQPTFCVLALLAALGIEHAVASKPQPRAMAGGALVLALLPLTWTWGDADLSGVRDVENYGRDLLDSAAPGSLVLCYDDTARNAMVFQQVVRGHRTDVAVVDPTAALDWHLAETRLRAPGFDPLGVSGTGWIGGVARQLLRDPSRGLYVTDMEGIGLAGLLGEDAAARVTTAPSGLLFRVVVPPPGIDPSALRNRLAAEASDAFWSSHSIPTLASERSDPQLGYIPVRYVRPRFLTAVAHVFSERPDLAEPHLVAIAQAEVDDYEDAVLANLRTIGIRAPDWNASARARRGLSAIRTHATRDQILLALAPE